MVLPCSFANAGIAASSIAILIVTGLAMLCPLLLVDTKNILQTHRIAALSGKPTDTFDDLALHALGRNGRRVSLSACFSLGMLFRVGGGKGVMHCVALRCVASYRIASHCGARLHNRSTCLHAC